MLSVTSPPMRNPLPVMNAPVVAEHITRHAEHRSDFPRRRTHIGASVASRRRLVARAKWRVVRYGGAR